MRFLSPLLIIFFALTVSGCVRLTASWADLKPKKYSAEPSLTFPDAPNPVQLWETQGRPTLQNLLLQEVYGYFPDSQKTDILSRRTIDADYLEGKATLEEITLSSTVTFKGHSAKSRTTSMADGYIFALLTPNNQESASPVILMETFCPRWAVVPHRGTTKPSDQQNYEDQKVSFGDQVSLFVFGRYICTPPLEEIIDKGYAVAVLAPGEFVPDRSESGLSELRRLAGPNTKEETRWGTISAWAFAFSRMIDVLEEDSRFDKNAMVAMGHSRYGKSALLAAALDTRIDGVISHQSGTGGASLNRRKVGESIKDITKTYPHWFAPAYANFAGRADEMSIDQHHLLALIAPRPLLLGNARRDVWSDPNGAFRAAQGANPAYALYGSKGLTVERLDKFLPEDDVAFWLRPGTHGVVEEDWPAFLAFLDAHFASKNRE